DVLGHVATSLGLTLPSGDSRPALARYLSGARTILVLDGFERLIETGPLLLDLLVDTPELTVLVTSIQPLGLHAEALYQLEGLGLTPAPDAPGTAGCAAVALFAGRARRALPGFQLAPHLADVWQLCRLVGGSPLGIELAAGLVRVLTPRELA